MSGNRVTVFLILYHMLALTFAAASALTLATTRNLLHSPAITRRDALLTGGAAAFAASQPQAATAATAAASKQTGLVLNTGTNFPSASFGLQIYDDATAKELTLIALEAGYRNFFASVLARNQRGFARAIKESGIPREDLFICGSVLSNQASGADAARRLSALGCQQNLDAFAVGGIDYVDMIMLDYPGPDADSIRGQWMALEEMAAAKTTRALAVSNFSPSQLDIILSMGPGVTIPTVNQLPYGVGFADYYPGGAANIVAENRKRGVQVQAWSPLQRAIRGSSKAACAKIGERYGKSAAQVALRWIVDTGCSYTTACTRSLGTNTAARFRENMEIFDFELTKEELAMLAKL